MSSVFFTKKHELISTSFASSASDLVSALLLKEKFQKTSKSKDYNCEKKSNCSFSLYKKTAPHRLGQVILPEAR